MGFFVRRPVQTPREIFCAKSGTAKYRHRNNRVTFAFSERTIYYQKRLRRETPTQRKAKQSPKTPKGAPPIYEGGAAKTRAAEETADGQGSGQREGAHVPAPFPRRRLAFLLGYRAVILSCRAVILACRAFLLSCCAFLLSCCAFLLSCRAFLLSCRAFLLACRAFLLSCCAFLLSCRAFLLSCRAFLLSCCAFLLRESAWLSS